MTEGLALEKSGIETNLLMSMPPWYMKNGKFEELPLSTLPGTKRNEGVDWPREYVVEKAKLWPSLLVACDGATTFNLTGVSVGSEKPDMFSDTTKEEMGLLFKIEPLGKGRTLTDLAEKLIPGCTTPGGKDRWFFELLVWANRHSANSELQATTREPPREKAKEWSVGKIAKTAANKLKGERNRRKPNVSPRFGNKFRRVPSGNTKPHENIPTHAWHGSRALPCSPCSADGRRHECPTNEQR